MFNWWCEKKIPNIYANINYNRFSKKNEYGKCNSEKGRPRASLCPSDLSSGRTPDKNIFFITTLTEIAHITSFKNIYIIYILYLYLCILYTGRYIYYGCQGPIP